MNNYDELQRYKYYLRYRFYWEQIHKYKFLFRDVLIYKELQDVLYSKVGDETHRFIYISQICLLQRNYSFIYIFIQEMVNFFQHMSAVYTSDTKIIGSLKKTKKKNSKQHLFKTILIACFNHRCYDNKPSISFKGFSEPVFGKSLFTLRLNKTFIFLTI